MPFGTRYDFDKKAGKILISIGLGMSLSSCGIAKKGDTCNLKANGLKLAGFSGEHLDDKQLSLVFLKGPGEATSEIGSYLHEHEVSATFFVTGEEAEKHEAVLEQLAEEGHRIGTGGFRFTAPKTAEDPVLELKAADALITPFAYGNQFWFFGEPDSLDADSLEQLKRAGLGKYIGPIHADTEGASFLEDEACWAAGMSVEACAQIYFDEAVRIGHGIIPFHDESEKTVELIKALVPELTAYGFNFVRLDQIPDLRLALSEVGGIPDAVKGAEACNDYE